MSFKKRQHIAIISAMSTDLATNGGQIIDVAIIICNRNNFTEVERFESAVAVKEGERIAPEASKYLTPPVRQKLIDAPSREYVFSLIWHFLTKYADMEPQGNTIPVCGHNVPHVLKLIENMAVSVGFPQIMNAFSTEVKDIMCLAQVVNDAATAKFGNAVYQYSNGTPSVSLEAICTGEGLELNCQNSEEKAELYRLLWLTQINRIGEMMEAEDKLSTRVIENGHYCSSCGCKAEVDTTVVFAVPAVKVVCPICGKSHIVQEA